MKTSILSVLATVQILACTAVCADGPMNTGLVQSLSKEHGTLTLRTDEGAGGSLVYYGMDKADILTAGGKPATIADISPGQRVSVFYAKRGDQWVVSRVLIPEPTPAPAALPAPVPAVTSRAATDGDITTKPANSAAIDRDRTTRAPKSAATDRDRTTVPAEGSRGALHRK